MQEIAWQLRTISPTRHVGFVSAAQSRQIQEDAAESADALADRDKLENDRVGATPQTTLHATRFVVCIARRGGPSGQKGEPCL